MKIPNFYIEDMLEAIGLIERYISGVGEKNFSNNTELQDAVIRRLTIIGEAAGKILPDIQQQAADIPWRKIIAFRNIAIHEYPNISIDIVWNICTHELPKLKHQLTKLQSSLPPPPKP